MSGADATSNGHLAHLVVEGGSFHLLQQESHNGLLDAGAEVCFVLLDEVGVFFQPVSEEIEKRGFDAAEGIVVSLYLRCRKMVGIRIALFGQPVDDGAARVSEVHDFCRFVDGFSGSIVDSLPKYLHLEVAAKEQNLCVSARDEKANERKFRFFRTLRLMDEMTQHMCLQVVHLNEWFSQSLSETFGETYAHHQRTHESGAAGESYGINILFLDSRLADGTVNNGDDILLVGTGSQLWHHATILFMNFLAGDDIAQQSVVLQHRCRCVITAGFYG